MRAVNLLPAEPKRTRKPLSLVGQLALVAPFVIAGLLTAGYLLASSGVNSKRTTLKALQQELASLPAPAEQQQQQSPSLASERSLRIAAVGAALESRLVWDRILRQISAVLPSDVWLTSLSAQTPQTPAQVTAPTAATPPATTTTTTSTTTTTTTTTPAAPAPATAPAPAAGPLSLNGYTYSEEGVARLLSRLAVVPALQDVKLVSASQTQLDGQDVVVFSIQADVRPQETG